MRFFKPCTPAVSATVSAPQPVMPQAVVSALTAPHPQMSSPACTSGLPECPSGITLLETFCCHIKGLPLSIGVADENHPLVAFSGNPSGCVDKDEDAWENFDGPLKTVLQKLPEEL